jgi:iron complex transport system ATP-binding protein
VSGVRIDHLSVEIDRAVILSSVDLSVESGQWMGLLGPNGAGKSTLLRALLNHVPSQGELTLNGVDLRAMPPNARARAMAWVPQRPSIPSDMSVFDYILLGRTPYISYFGVESRKDRDTAREAAAVLELVGYEHRLLGTLSGGEIQRVVMARALAQQAPVLLLDEPTTALDVGHQQAVLELVDTLRKSHGLTIISALHDLTLAAQFCDQVVLLAGGRVVAQGGAPTVLTEIGIRQHYGARVRVINQPDGSVAVIPIRH